MTTEQTLLSEVEDVIVVYENLIGNPAARTRQMIQDIGIIPALSKLVISPDLQQGFRVLRDRNQLEHSFEALVVKYANAFSKNVVEAARWRLDNAYKLL